MILQFIQYVFAAVFSLGRSLTANCIKCVSLDKESFIVSLDRYNRNCNNLDDPSGKMCIPNKTKHVNLNAFNVIIEISESKTLIKHISRKCRFKFDFKKWNNKKCQCECKKAIHHVCKKY